MQIAKKIFICFLIVGISVFGFTLLTDVCVKIFSDWGLEVANNGAQVADTIRNNFFAVFLQTAIWAPIYEEMIFRLLVIELLFLFFKHMKNTKLKETLIIIISAVIFMLWHRSWSQTIYQFIMGVVFAVVYVKTPNKIHRAFNLFWTMLIHFLNNAFLVTYIYFTGSGDTLIVLNFYNIAIAVILAVISVAIIRDLLKLFRLKGKDDGNKAAIK